MARYYVNNKAQANGDHEVYKVGCYWLSLVIDKTYLGEHLTCTSAVRKAKQTHARANGCHTCSRECHIS